ncbi:hypothetical protein [Pseudarthrobacter sp. N5]|uniref:hypothetical protein n=1 Tax=Pseudarthrobacter sp. N5 TaxID=3418416 RepID=UPI003CE7538D
MFSFGKSGKSGKSTLLPLGRHMGREVKRGRGTGSGAAEGTGAFLADALQLRDMDPVPSNTATEQLRREDARYVKVWPSDLPHKPR